MAAEQLLDAKSKLLYGLSLREPSVRLRFSIAFHPYANEFVRRIN
jgi:hypothetical protein